MTSQNTPQKLLAHPQLAAKNPADVTVVVAMSGGVDSSVVAGLLHKAGYNTIGITLQLWDYTPASNGGSDKKFGTCCALDDVYDARRVCQTLGIPHYVMNMESAFKEAVVNDFVETYLAGATPIPCVRCNQRIKFDALLNKAKALGADVLVTGHYVQKVYNGKQAELHRGSDPVKDQSYFLFTTTRQQLEYVDFPLGRFCKTETRAMAKELGLHLHHKKDSQGICFVPGGDYRKVIRREAPEATQPGTILHEDGTVLGHHDGIIDFTVGQRKGLGGGQAEPLYVVAIRPHTREVVVGPRESLGKKVFTVKELNWIGEMPADGLEVLVKVRSMHDAAEAVLKDIGNGRVEVTMFTPQQQISPGQAAVFYVGQRMLGGGWIEVPAESRRAPITQPTRVAIHME